MEGLGMNNVDLPGGSCGLSGLPAEENAFGHPYLLSLAQR